MKLKIKDFPERLEIEISSACNLRCVYCPRHFLRKLKGFMRFELFKKIIDEIRVINPILVLHRRGESLLHPNFSEMLDYLNGDFKEVQMATNGTLLTEEKFQALVNNLTFISFSMDTPESFNKTRIPANYEDVKKNILKFLSYNKEKVTTQVSMVNIGQPEEEIDAFIAFWKDKVNRVRIYEAHSLDGNFGSLKVKRERKPCIMPFYQMTIYEDGRVARCNHDWNSDGMGDVNKNSVKAVWNSVKYKKLREQHANLNLTDSVCSKCDSWYPEMRNQGTGKVIENE